MSGLPEKGDEVMLVIPQREAVPANVLASGDTFLDLGLLGSLATPRRVLERTTLTVEFVHDTGVSGLQGKLDLAGEVIGRGGSEDARVRFAHRRAVQLLQRREHIRATASVPVLASGDDDDAIAQSATIVDVSGGGLLVHGLDRPSVGAAYDLAFHLHGGELAIRARGRVVRVDEDGAAGVQFISIDERDRDRIVQFAFDAGRSHRRKVA